MTLSQRGDEFSIRVGRDELMNSRSHGSEEALAEITVSRLTAENPPRILIGGLGMGYTLAAALRVLTAGSEIDVAEIVPAVVAWNRGPLSALAGHPLRDPRVRVLEGDVCELIRSPERPWDAIVLDVDNGPESFTRGGNDWLYARSGLGAIREALAPRGILSVWSAGPDRRFVEKLRHVGFDVDEIPVRAHGHSRASGARHTVWVARRRS